MSDIVYLNGSFIPREEAKISPEDRGFNFADGVYEVIKFYSGKPFRWEDHINRLRYSISETGIGFNDYGNLGKICSFLLNENKLNNINSAIYLQITRGAHRRIHHFPDGIEPTVYFTAFEMPAFVEKLRDGIRIIIHEDIRWLRCDIKSISLLPNTMLYQKAVLAGADECVLIRDGKITEATHSSVIGIIDGKVFTHPLSHLILPGITRMVIAEICKKSGIPFIEEPILAEDFSNLDEIIIAGTGSEIMPVVQINDKPVGEGKPGPITRIIQQDFFSQTYSLLGGELSWWNWDQ